MTFSHSRRACSLLTIHPQWSQALLWTPDCTNVHPLTLLSCSWSLHQMGFTIDGKEDTLSIQHQLEFVGIASCTVREEDGLVEHLSWFHPQANGDGIGLKGCLWWDFNMSCRWTCGEEQPSVTAWKGRRMEREKGRMLKNFDYLLLERTELICYDVCYPIYFIFTTPLHPSIDTYDYITEGLWFYLSNLHTNLSRRVHRKV